MLEPPTSLDPVEPLARAVYESGWRPACSPGPTRDELVRLIDRMLVTMQGRHRERRRPGRLGQDGYGQAR